MRLIIHLEEEEGEEEVEKEEVKGVEKEEEEVVIRRHTCSFVVTEGKLSSFNYSVTVTSRYSITFNFRLRDIN